MIYMTILLLFADFVQMKHFLIKTKGFLIVERLDIYISKTGSDSSETGLDFSVEDKLNAKVKLGELQDGPAEEAKNGKYIWDKGFRRQLSSIIRIIFKNLGNFYNINRI